MKTLSFHSRQHWYRWNKAVCLNVLLHAQFKSRSVHCFSEPFNLCRRRLKIASEVIKTVSTICVAVRCISTLKSTAYSMVKGYLLCFFFPKSKLHLQHLVNEKFSCNIFSLSVSLVLHCFLFVCFRRLIKGCLSCFTLSGLSWCHLNLP